MNTGTSGTSSSWGLGARERPPDGAAKVFCIGFPKTGTAALSEALSILGYNVANERLFRPVASNASLSHRQLAEFGLEIAAEYDALVGAPWPLLFEELDAAHPDAKFILVTRNVDNWAYDAARELEAGANAIDRLLYGDAADTMDEERLAEAFDKHTLAVLEYFQDRPDDFVELNLSDGEVAWETICPFLGVEIPHEPWPESRRRRGRRRGMLLGFLKARFGAN
ncbi:MAG: sulfotransferase family protein [Pseudomonadota bacterium]